MGSRYELQEIRLHPSCNSAVKQSQGTEVMEPRTYYRLKVPLGLLSGNSDVTKVGKQLVKIQQVNAI